VTEDVVWVEVGGCAHLHGGESALGASARGARRAGAGDTRAAWSSRTAAASASAGRALREVDAGAAAAGCRPGRARGDGRAVIAALTAGERRDRWLSTSVSGVSAICRSSTPVRSARASARERTRDAASSTGRPARRSTRGGRRKCPRSEWSWSGGRTPSRRSSFVPQDAVRFASRRACTGGPMAAARLELVLWLDRALLAKFSRVSKSR